MIDDPQDRLRRHAFSAAALTDDPERLSREDVEGGAVDGLGRSLVLEEAGRRFLTESSGFVAFCIMGWSELQIGIRGIP